MFTQLTNTRGATMVEYSLLLALIAVIAIVGLAALGESLDDTLLFIDGEVSDVVTP